MPARALGPTHPDRRIELSLVLRPRRPLEELEGRLSEHQRPLTREEFAAAYGADPADLEKVESFARRHGLDVVEASAARRTVRVAGRAADLASLFGVQLLEFQEEDGTRFRAPSGEPREPDELKDVVQAVFGLDTRPRARRTLDVQYAGRPMANALKPEELDALRAIDSPTIANAIEYFSVRPRVAGYCGTNVRNLTPEAGVMLGYAVTCLGDSTTEEKDRREHSQLYRAILAEQPQPVVVVIGDDGDPRKIHLSCHAGEMMATTMKRVGAVGLVTNGGLRDIREINALGGFHYYGRGLVVAHGRPCIYDVGATVNIDGMEVRPGDLLHGDENGISVIPAEIASQVAAKAMEHREMEQERLQEILGPDFHRQFETVTEYR